MERDAGRRKSDFVRDYGNGRVCEYYIFNTWLEINQLADAEKPLESLALLYNLNDYLVVHYGPKHFMDHWSEVVGAKIKAVRAMEG